MSCAAQALAFGEDAHAATDHRPFRLRGDLVGRGVEELRELIAELVHERQQLRASGASHTSLERNRRQLARSQWELSYALIGKSS
jgi:ribosomal protein L29